MIETGTYTPESAPTAIEVPDVDMEVVESLLGNHREDFVDMYENEKIGFLKVLAEDAADDSQPEIQLAAKIFLKELKEKHED